MDTASTVSSITPQSRERPVTSSGSTSSGGGFSLLAGGNLVTLVHILSEITAFVAMGMWVRSRTSSLQKQVNELRDVVQQQTAVINDHTEALNMLLNSRPTAPPAPTTPQPQPDPVATQQPQPQQDFMSFPPEPTAEREDSPPHRPRVEMLSPINEAEETAESEPDNDQPDPDELDDELEAELAALN